MNKLILAVLVLGLASCGAPAGSRQAPALVLPDLAGKTVDLTSFRGKPVLINFWATWCDTCREEMPDLESLHGRLSPKGVVILGVSMDENAYAVVPPFLKEHKITFPILIADRKASAAYAVRGLPAAFLIDPEGRIARRWVGALDVRAAENDIVAQLNRRP
ncbi:MAG: TlpA disulfide reductase family protein [Elusimicrobiota bacterium]